MLSLTTEFFIIFLALFFLEVLPVDLGLSFFEGLLESLLLILSPTSLETLLTVQKQMEI